MAMAGGTLKSLLVRLGVDSKSFDKGIAAADKKTTGLTKAFSGLATVGGGILVAAGAAAAAGAVALASTIKPASDLEEAINAVKVVFGDAGEEITKFGETSAMQVGLSSREFNQLSAEMGAMLANVGIEESKLAGETINLVERAADMASIFNTDVAQAFNAIQSAIKGEFNPLEQFGVKMNMALINAKALSMGLVETNVDILKLGEASIKVEKAILKSAEATKEHGAESLEAREAIVREAKAQAALEAIMEGTAGTITDSAKAQAALALVYEQTDKVAGDFQNTSEGLANSQRQLGAWIEDTKAKIGAKLLPALEGILAIGKDMIASEDFEKFLDGIIEGVSKLADWITKTVPVIIKNISKFSNWLKNNRGVVIGILAAMGVAVAAFVYMTVLPALTALWVGMWPVLAIMAAVAAVAYLVYEAWTNNWGGIQEKVALAKEIIVGIIQTLTNKIIAIWNTFMSVIRPIIEAFQAAFSGDWYTFGEKIREAWDTAWALISTAVSTFFGNIRDTVLEFLPKVKKWFMETDWLEVGINIIKGIAEGITSAVGFIKDAAVNAAKAAWQAAKGFLGEKSPSTLFADIGQNMMLGMAGGIADYSGIPVGVTVAATQNIAGSAVPPASPTPSGEGGIDEVRLARLLRDAMLQVME